MALLLVHVRIQIVRQNRIPIKSQVALLVCMVDTGAAPVPPGSVGFQPAFHAESGSHSLNHARHFAPMLPQGERPD
jgi:hypothetical protein